MGTWAYGPFDNDTAADYAGNLRDLPTPYKRTQQIITTLNEVMDAKLEATDLGVYALGWQLEQAVAAAAIVADAHQGVMKFTDSVYARGVMENDELGDPPDIGRVVPALVKLAALVIRKTMIYMMENGAGPEWREQVNFVGQALRTSTGGRS